MNPEAEIDERLGHVETLRVRRRSLHMQMKELRADQQKVNESIEILMEEIREIREGGGAQETLGGSGVIADPVDKLDKFLKENNATMTVKGPGGSEASIGKKRKKN